MSLPTRFAYWLVLLGAADVCLRLTHWVVEAFLARHSLAKRLATSAVGFSVIFSPVVWALSALFSDELYSLMGFGIIVANVLGLTCTIGILNYLLERDRDGTSAPRAQLYERLPMPTNASITRLTVSDHYVNVFLDDGTRHRLLMRLADAVREMDDTPGFSTHRSHWVSLAHVTGTECEQNREYVLLTDGVKVPISKTYRENVRAAGFL